MTLKKIAINQLLNMLILGLGGLGANGIHAQNVQTTKLNFKNYLNAVEANSLELAAQRETIVSAEAGVGIAGIRPDPEFTYSASRETVKAIHPRPVSRGPSLSMTIETGGKRDARIKSARSNVTLTEATVAGFRQQLYSDSALAFAEACRTRDVLERKEYTLKALSEIVRINEVRRKAGDVGGIELLQSRVERDQFRADVTQSRAEATSARLELSLLLGRRVEDIFGQGALECSFTPFERGSDVATLIPEALQSRQDVLIARAALEHARDNASLTRANRSVDPTVSLGVEATRGYPGGFDNGGNAIDATSRSNVLALSITIPIPLSRLNRGDIVQAESAVTQAMLELNHAQLKAESDVRTAHQRFMAAHENVDHYRKDVLGNANRMLEGIRLSYRNGEASLLELLAAQRSADEAYLAYLQSEADMAIATVQLQLAIGEQPSL
ncbi:TolC family protein [Herminiimonas sp. KBW02]|uniref:TolC family protein n=1 Tax=Herminiimonas sp. KBW02 TaxID=2153363 RepID=UPI000F5B2DB0|nr:TolC family protein [Herminiimonas sp. KBW02]RQO35784.1 TolC family protein [Herminiimonas sp. KBW02]